MQYIKYVCLQTFNLGYISRTANKLKSVRPNNVNFKLILKLVSLIMKKLKSKAQTRDYKKECLFKELASKLSEHGITVRREKLKQGPGWKAISGSCYLAEQGLIFVDSRLSQDEQINLLSSKLSTIAVNSSEIQTVASN